MSWRVTVPSATSTDPPVLLQTSIGASIELIDRIDTDEILDTPPEEEDDTEIGTVPAASSLLEGDDESSSNKESLIGSPHVKPKKKCKASKRKQEKCDDPPDEEDQDEFGSPVVRKKKRVSGKDLNALAGTQSVPFDQLVTPSSSHLLVTTPGRGMGKGGCHKQKKPKKTKASTEVLGWQDPNVQ